MCYPCSYLNDSSRVVILAVSLSTESRAELNLQALFLLPLPMHSSKGLLCQGAKVQVFPFNCFPTIHYEGRKLSCSPSPKKANTKRVTMRMGKEKRRKRERDKMRSIRDIREETYQGFSHPFQGFCLSFPSLRLSGGGDSLHLVLFKQWMHNGLHLLGCTIDPSTRSREIWEQDGPLEAKECLFLILKCSLLSLGA